MRVREAGSLLLLGVLLMIDVEFVKINLEVTRKERFAAGGKSLADLVKSYRLHQQTQEVVWVIAHGKNGYVHSIIEVARGSHAEVNVEISSVMTAVLAVGAPAFAMAHNHPTMSALPSIADHNLTHTVMAAANACGLTFDDHVIVEPGGDFYSFRDAGLIIGASALPTKAASKRKA